MVFISAETFPRENSRSGQSTLGANSIAVGATTSTKREIHNPHSRPPADRRQREYSYPRSVGARYLPRDSDRLAPGASRALAASRSGVRRRWLRGASPVRLPYALGACCNPYRAPRSRLDASKPSGTRECCPAPECPRACRPARNGHRSGVRRRACCPSYFAPTATRRSAVSCPSPRGLRPEGARCPPRLRSVFSYFPSERPAACRSRAVCSRRGHCRRPCGCCPFCSTLREKSKETATPNCSRWDLVFIGYPCSFGDPNSDYATLAA